MAIDPNLLDHMAAQSLQSVGYDAGLVRVIGANTTQMGAAVLTTVVQQAASVTDDAAINAALSAADRVPVTK